MLPISVSKTIFICIVMFFAGFIDSIAGGGGCISLPAFLLTGLPTQTAFACNKTSACIGTSVATFKYIKAKSINIKVTLISAAAGLIGSNIAAHIIFLLDADLFQKILVCVIPFIALFLILKKDFGEENDFDSVPAKKVWIISITAGLILGLYDGLIGPGTGTFAIMLFASVLKFDLKTAGGNSKLLNFCTGIGSVVHYIAVDAVVWPLVILTAGSDILGNYIGSTLALKKGNKFIRIVMVAAVVILLGKLAADILLK